MRTSEQVSAMACPVCRVPLAMSDRQGIEIDYCPQCRGVWLDRGELDKIVERSAADAPAASPQPAPQPQYAPPPPRDHTPRGYEGQGHDQRYSQGYGGKPHRKQKHWLSEIFD